MGVYVSIGLGVVSVLLAFWAAREIFLSGRRRTAAKRPAAPPDWRVETAARLRLLEGFGLEATGEARDLLGLGESAAQDQDALLESLRNGRDALATALDGLRKNGAAFAVRIETASGRIVEARGAPVGVEPLVSLTDQTALLRRLERAEDEAQRMKSELGALRRAHHGAGVVAWRLGADGEIRVKGARGDPDVYSEAPEEDLLTALRRLSGDDASPKRRVVAARGGDLTVYELIHAEPLAAGGGEYAARDVSEAARAEQAMEHLVDTMSETFAHLKVGLMIFDAERRLTLFNPAIIEIFGGGSDWLARRPLFRELLDQLRAMRVLPEQIDYTAWRERLIAAAEHEQPTPTQEIWHLTNGRSLMVLMRPHPSGGLAVVVEDVSESMALRRSSSSERSLRRATTDMLEEGIAVFGPDGLLRMANVALRRIWKLNDDQTAIGRHVSDLIEIWEVETGAERFWSALSEAATQGRGRAALAEKLTLADGRLIFARLSPMPDGSTLVVFGDATATERVAEALKERNDVLEHADEMRSALVDQISHQMRTPLNSIFGFGQLLEGERFGDLNETQKDYVIGIIQGCDDLMDAINGMSDLISIGNAAERTTTETVDPDDLLQDVMALAERRLGARAVELHGIASGRPFVFGGPRVRLRQMLFNMIMDASVRSRPEETICVSIEFSVDLLSLTCSCRPLSSAPESALALALVRRFARLSGGETEVSETPDGDRVTTVKLPASGAQQNAADKPLEEIARTV
ncbi:MAG: PAS-domain containing protein [Pseudomonadota bacterium]